MQTVKRLLSLILAFAMVCTVLPVDALAIDKNNAVLPDRHNHTGFDHQINPLYEDVIDPDSIHWNEKTPPVPDASTLDINGYESVSEVALQVREHLVNRDTNFTIYVYSNSSSARTTWETVFAEAYAHTGVPYEGDALQWVWKTWSFSYYDGYSSGYYTYMFNIEMEYYTTKAMEDELTAQVDAVLDYLNVYNATDYQKTYAVYKYICDNVVYDYANLNNQNYFLQYTAYAALMHGTAVCQGYAILFYRFMLELGVDARLIAGDGGGPHAWNIVELGNRYYNLDSTWDAGNYYYQWFLLSPNNFPQHYRYEEWDTPEFHAQYPMASTNYDPNESPVYPDDPVPSVTTQPVADEGQCGANAYYTLEDGILTIYGTGSTWDFPEGSPSPWEAIADTIDAIVVEEGITRIGKWAFFAAANNTSVQLPSTLTEVAEGAFMYNESLPYIDIPDNVTLIDHAAFYRCFSLSGVDLPANLTTLGEQVFQECAMNTIEIPRGVTSIGYGCFAFAALYEIYFAGNAPAIGENAFYEVVSYAYYPQGNATWTSSVRQNYGGSITWVSYAASAPVAMEIVQLPNTSYVVGDTLDLTGMIVGITYEDGSYSEVGGENLTVISCDLNTVGVQTAVVGYENLTVSFDVYVHAGIVETPVDESQYPESSHPYGEYEEDMQIVSYPGASGLILTFSEDTNLETSWDYLFIYDKYDNEIASFTGSAAAGTSVYVPGDTAKIYLETDGSVCYWGYSFSSIVALAVEHTGESTGRVEPTCTEPGSTGGFVCEVCGEQVGGQEIPALGHDYVSTVVEPTCTEEGHTLYECSRCGDSYTEDVVPATGHEFGSWMLTTPNTCTEDGEETRGCLNCGETETRVVEATGHDYDSVVTAPTCVEDGYTTHTCVYCDNSYVDSYVDALDHDWDEGTVTVEPTEDTAGVLTHHCSRCDETYTEVIPPLDHTHSYESVVVEPTCTEDGYTEHTCATCGHVYRDNQVDALGHNYTSVVTEPTCTEGGYTTHTCDRCGDSYTDHYEDPNGHDFFEGVCEDCGELDPYYIPLDYILGDADGNEIVNNIDAMKVLQYAVGLLSEDDLDVLAGDVDGNGLADNIDAMKILQYAVGLIDSFAAYSRGGWIQKLIEVCGFPMDVVTTENVLYTDVADSEYLPYIQVAIVYGLLRPEEGEAFLPDEPATREFAAETAVYCLGYDPTEPINCVDLELIDNPATAAKAIELDLLDMVGEYFMPDRDMTAAEARHILQIMEGEYELNDNDEPDGFVFLDEVIVKTGEFDWTQDGDMVVVPAGEEIPQVGQIVVFGTDKAIKVESVATHNGETRLTYSEPELHEFLDYIDIQGESEVDMGEFIPAEGVEIITEEMLNESPNLYGFMDDWFDVDREEIDINEFISLPLKHKINDNVEIVVKLDIAIPSVEYKFDIDFDFGLFNDEPLANVHNAYVKMSKDLTAHVEVVFRDEDRANEVFYPPYIELGSIPLLGADGIGIVVEVDLVLTGEGKFTLDLHAHGALGAQVKNNQPKNISAFQLSPPNIGLEASLKLGFQIGVLAEVFEKDLLTIKTEIGVNGTASATLQNNGMVCIDARAFAYWDLTLFEDCLIDDWLDIEIVFEIWNKDHSIWNPDPFHIERYQGAWNIVDECTYESSGTVFGVVANATDRNQRISGALIEFLENDEFELVTTATSDSNGEYTQIVPADTYMIRVSADGYIPFDCMQTVGENQLVYVEALLMVEGDEDSGEEGLLNGAITNSMTGSGISNVSLTFRKGWNMVDGEIVDTITTGSDGRYSISLPLGNYTVCMERDGFVSGHFNVAVPRLGNDNGNGTMTPDGDSSVELGDMRIVLTWGQYPRDLDSHLWGPTVDGEDMFHIAYYDKNYYYDGETRAYLDVDDTSSYGPETTTIYDMTANGVYSFYVHDYSNRHYDNATNMANSGAKVQVYMGEELIATYHVPANGAGTVWHVFDFDATTGTIVGVNLFYNESDPSDVGMPSGYSLNTFAPAAFEKEYEKAN